MQTDFSPLGMKVILKWFKDPHQAHNILSKSLGKYSYVHPRYAGVKPDPGSMWVCQIEHESNPKQKRGAFLVVPLHEVSRGEDGRYALSKLMPGFYTKHTLGDILVLEPSADLGAKNWIAPLSFKRALPSQIYAVLVPVQGV